VLAVMAATRSALDRARNGGGPTFIEAVTYRRGPHTTSDDPSRYVDPVVAKEWEARDPIMRVEAYLRREGVLTDELAASIQGRADEVAAEFREGCLSLENPEPLSVFDNVYATEHSGLTRQKSQYKAYLEGFEK